MSELASEPSGVESYRATVQYDGSGYFGFQRQAAGTPTVQGALEQALTVLAGKPVLVIGAGRTDTGVHALGQVIRFTIDWPEAHGPDALRRALNANLPADIAVLDVVPTTAEFHPRFDARRRSYVYRILNRPVRDPLRRKRAWHVSRELDVARMNDAAVALMGTQDFATFGSAPVGDNTVRTVYEAVWEQQGDELHFRICANAFLYRMVRRTVGTLHDVGVGRLSVDEFGQALAACDPARTGTTAPAYGLYLAAVEYEIE